jgi:hypothetical protein
MFIKQELSRSFVFEAALLKIGAEYMVFCVSSLCQSQLLHKLPVASTQRRWSHGLAFYPPDASVFA